MRDMNSEAQIREPSFHMTRNIIFLT